MSGERLYFWAIGDMHYRAQPIWESYHRPRFERMFEDLHTLWREEGEPAFCVSPGDLVETCLPENHRLAKSSLEAYLGHIPFYSGIGNHEYHNPEGCVADQIISSYTSIWDRPVRYTWIEQGITCIMLDYPDPTTLAQETEVYISQQTLNYLSSVLTCYPDQIACIFLHCPLQNTVLDRDPAQHRDYNSLQHFFAPENSQAIRDLLARHQRPILYFSGHTHSGWEAPNLVLTDYPGAYPITYVNLMSPWYTGRQTGLRPIDEVGNVRYIPDTPDVIPSFSVRIFSDHISLRVRDHAARQWLKEWKIPLPGIKIS